MEDLSAWCREHLGDAPAQELFRLRQTSSVVGLRLADGREIVVKARDDDGRAASCVAAQAELAARGLPCARPLTGVVPMGALAAHAEEYRPGGEMLRGDSAEVAARYAEVFARLMVALAGASSGAFASAGPPTLAPVDSSAEFLAVYQAVRRRRFTAEETQVAWAASLWPAAHNARWEALHGAVPASGDALRTQVAERLRRAAA